jgi:hypothetical protein
VAAAAPGFAYSLTNNGSAYAIAKGTANVTGAVVIPSSYNGLPVTAIADAGFSQIEGMTSVTLPSSIVSIGQGAFRDCSNLATVGLSEGVPSLGSCAFAYCPIASFSVAAGNSVCKVLSGSLYSIDGSTLLAYPAGSAATSYAVPAGTTELAILSFARALNLVSVTLPSGLIKIDSCCFWGANFSALSIPASVTNIESPITNFCTSLAAITVDSANLNYSSQDGVFFSKDKKTLFFYPPALASISFPGLDGNRAKCVLVELCREWPRVYLCGERSSDDPFGKFLCRPHGPSAPRPERGVRCVQSGQAQPRLGDLRLLVRSSLVALHKK